MAEVEHEELPRGGRSLSSPDDLSARTPIESMKHAFARAIDANPAELFESRYLFAGRAVHVRVVGTRLAERTHRAFAHLAHAPGAATAPRLRIDLWDESETGVPCPLDQDEAANTKRWIACDGTLEASQGGHCVSFRYQDSVTTLDRRAQHLVGCRQSGSCLSRGECSKPFVLLLSIWYHDRGVQILHAGLLAADGRGVLLPGESGAGKSTTSLAGAAQGLEYLGDDFVGLERTSAGGFLGHSVYNTTCLARDGLAHFPDVLPRAVDDRFPEEEKPILFLSEVYPERLRASVPIDVVVLLRIRSERTEIRPARPSEVLRRFAASTLHTVVPRPGRAALQKMATLAETVPAYWLMLGPDLGEVRPSIERIVAEAGVRASR